MSSARETIKAVNHRNGLVSFSCPDCGEKKKVSLKRLAGRHVVKAKCTCHHRFNLEVNHRNKNRRKVDIPAFCEKSAGEQPVPIGTDSLRPLQGRPLTQVEKNCHIVDLSKEGIAIRADCELDINEDDIIKVYFNLDDIAGTQIYQDYKVMNVIKNRFGCSIIGSNIHLDFYSPITR